MIRRRHFTAAAAAGAIAPFSVRSQGSPVKASLRLKWLPQSQFAGFYHALEKGYYREQGIDLTINPGGPNLLPENLVATGADTFATSGGADSVLSGVEKGLPIVCVGVMQQLSPFVFVARKNTQKGVIKTPKDFEGKRVTVWFTGAQYILHGMLDRAGADRAKVEIQPQQVSITPFVNGQVDAVAAVTYGDLGLIKEKIGPDNVVVFAPEDFGISVIRETLIVSKETAQKNPRLVTGFLRASIRGWKEVLQNQKAAIDMIMKIAPTSDRSRQEYMLSEISRLMLAGDVKTRGLFYMDEKKLQAAQSFLVAAKALEKTTPIGQVFDSSFLQAVPLAERLMS